MNISELCQVLESQSNQEAKLKDTTCLNFLSFTLDSPRMAFVITSTELTVKEILKSAKRYFGKGKAPVVCLRKVISIESVEPKPKLVDKSIKLVSKTKSSKKVKKTIMAKK